MASETVPGAAPTGSTETLRRVKQVETDLESKLAEARAESDRVLAGLRTEAEQAVRAAQADAEKVRDEAVHAARTRLEAEAEAIVKAGETEARSIEAGAKVDLDSLRSKLLKVALSGFTEASED